MDWQVWYEAFVITSVLASVFGVWTFLLLYKLPTQDGVTAGMKEIAAVYAKEFGLTSPGPGGRPSEGLLGLVERFVSTPQGMEMIQGFLGKGQSGSIGLTR